MDGEYYAFALLILILLIGAFIVYLLIKKMMGDGKIKEEIIRKFNARERNGDLYLNFRGYDVIITLKPEPKASILHEKDVENVKSPKGAKLTPMYLIFPVKKVEKLGEDLQKYTEFLDSIPTR